jgi:hypothetical protein
MVLSVTLPLRVTMEGVILSRTLPSSAILYHPQPYSVIPQQYSVILSRRRRIQTLRFAQGDNGTQCDTTAQGDIERRHPEPHGFCHSEPYRFLSFCAIFCHSVPSFVILSRRRRISVRLSAEFILSETKELQFLHFVQDALRSLRMTFMLHSLKPLSTQIHPSRIHRFN